MFRIGKNGRKGGSVGRNTLDVFIGKGTSLEGKIISEGSVRIEGRVDGDIECAGDVAVGKEGVVHSNIRARHVVNAGTIHGHVVAEGRVSLTATGRLFGTIQASALAVEEGAWFQGTSKMEVKSVSRLADAKSADARETKTSEAVQAKTAKTQAAG